MEILCPNCQRKLTILEQYAGMTMKCPMCAGQFTAPALPSVAATPPPGASIPAAPAPGTHEPEAALPPLEPPPSAPSSPPMQWGDVKLRYSVAINPRFTQYVPAAALVLVFLLTFFPWEPTWDRSHGSWVPELSLSSAWRVGFGQNGLVSVALYLVFLPLNFLVAAAAVVMSFIHQGLPPSIQVIVRWRWVILGAATCVGFGFIFLHDLAGFSTGIDPRTLWYRCAYWLHFWALVFAILTTLAELRSPGPYPRVDVSW